MKKWSRGQKTKQLGGRRTLQETFFERSGCQFGFLYVVGAANAGIKIKSEKKKENVYSFGE